MRASPRPPAALALGALQGGGRNSLALDGRMPPPAAAGHRLDHHGQPDAASLFDEALAVWLSPW
jgi:hypothetical protein